MQASLIHWLKSVLGLDRAIAASTLTQVMRFVTGPITMLLMIRCLRPEEQGFYYSFVGVTGLQIFLEAGFAQSITQFTSKEFSRLRFVRGRVLAGKADALSRLRSIFQQANHYYRWMAAVLVVALAAGGYFFFAAKPSYGVPWMIPWLVVSGTAGVTFCLTPYWAFLEGCNRVADVASYRLWSGIIGFLAMASGLLLGYGIYVVVWAAAFNLAVPFFYLWWKWRRLIAQVKRPPGAALVSWRNEIWGFQWRIAVTWMSRYFMESGIAPLTFQLAGPVAAGQTGMTFQIVRMIGSIANMWTVTKIPFWGMLAAKGNWPELEKSWRQGALRNVLFTTVGVVSLILVFPLLGSFWPDASDRFLEQPMIACFAGGWVFYSFWLVSMHYTRALRTEPYTFIHVAVGLVFLVSCVALSPQLGIKAIPICFLLVHLIPAFITLKIRQRIRTEAMLRTA